MTPSLRRPPLRAARQLLAAVLLAGAVLGLAGGAGAQDQTRVDIVEVVGVLDPPLAGFLERTVRASAGQGADVLVIRLDTPGALGGDVDGVVAAIRESAIPVVVYVGTPGAQAAGAGVAIAAAAHVLALAPATVFGAATPWDLGSAVPDAATVEETLAALAQERGRDTGFAREAARGRLVIAVPDGEAGTPVAPGTDFPPGAEPATAETLDAHALRAAGIAEVVAPNLQGVLADLDGREVVLPGGPATLEVDPATAGVRFVNVGLLARVLHTAANPTLAYLLLLGGALALLFEVFQPGFGVAGVAGLLILALGGYALTVVPVSWPFLVLAVVGMLLLAADLALARLGTLTTLGTLGLGVGSWLLWAQPALRPPLWLVVAGTLLALVFFVVVMTTVLRAQGNAAHQGAEAVTGQVGIVRSVLNPEGHVFVGGQLWRARAPEGAGRVRTGTRVRVVGLSEQLTLEVELDDDDRQPTGV